MQALAVLPWLQVVLVRVRGLVDPWVGVCKAGSAAAAVGHGAEAAVHRAVVVE